MLEQDYRVWDKSLILEKNIKVISCDIFDTLLFRNGRPERKRFSASAAAIKSLSRTSYRTLEDIFSARVRAHTWLYSLWVNGHHKSEPRFEDICDLQLSLLLDSNLNRDILIQAELDTEIKALEENKLISRWLAAAQASGALVVFLSDIYHASGFIRKIMRALNINNHLLEAEIYTSSEIGKSKLRGDAFDFILNLYGIEAGSLIHIGDNYVSDLINASRRGIRAYHTPRSKAYLLKSQLLESTFNMSYLGRIDV